MTVPGLGRGRGRARYFVDISHEELYTLFLRSRYAGIRPTQHKFSLDVSPIFACVAQVDDIRIGTHAYRHNRKHKNGVRYWQFKTRTLREYLEQDHPSLKLPVKKADIDAEALSEAIDGDMYVD